MTIHDSDIPKNVPITFRNKQLIYSREQSLCGSVRLSSRDTLDENLGLIIEVQTSVFPENVLDVREHLERNGELGLDVTIICVSYCAGILVMLGEGASP